MSLESQLKQQEDYSSVLYQDSEGVWTIGWGTNIETIEKEEAEWLFQYRLKKSIERINKELPWLPQLDQARRDVVYNMAYNMGVKRLLEFKEMLGHMRLGEWKEAALAGLDSRWRVQVKGRAYKLMRQLETGIEVE